MKKKIIIPLLIIIIIAILTIVLFLYNHNEDITVKSDMESTINLQIMLADMLNYNDEIRIAIINPEKLTETSEDISKKEIYEEILLNIFEK